MTRSEILTIASQYVTNDREADHGRPEDTFGLIATYWSAHLGVTVKAHDVALMMALLKAARLAQNPASTDGWVDLAGYAACGGELATEASRAVHQPIMVGGVA